MGGEREERGKEGGGRGEGGGREERGKEGGGIKD